MGDSVICNGVTDVGWCLGCRCGRDTIYCATLALDGAAGGSPNRSVHHTEVYATLGRPPPQRLAADVPQSHRSSAWRLLEVDCGSGIGRHRRRGARNRSLRCPRAFAYGCPRCIATGATRSECKHDTANCNASDGLPNMKLAYLLPGIGVRNAHSSHPFRTRSLVADDAGARATYRRGSPWVASTRPVPQYAL